MIVNGAIDDGNSIQLTMSLLEFKDVFILLDMVVNQLNPKYDRDKSINIITNIMDDVHGAGMTQHNAAEIYTLLHACSILMRPLADNIVAKGRHELSKVPDAKFIN